MKKVTGDTIYELCVRNRWFTAGSTRQYAKLFEINRKGATLEELAMFIWVCSEDEDGSFLDRKAIYDKLVANSYET